MKHILRRLLPIVYCLFMAAPAAMTAEPVPIKLKLGQLKGVSEALAAIDHGETETITQEGKEPERRVVRQFRLSIPIRVAIATNLEALTTQLKTLQGTVKSIATEVWGKEKVDEAADTPEAAKFREKLAVLSEQEVEVPLLKMSRAELYTNADDPKAKPNQIPFIGVLQNLAPLLTP